jgi:homoserine O-acetyltransferase
MRKRALDRNGPAIRRIPPFWRIGSAIFESSFMRVVKKIFELPQFTTLSGNTIRNVRIGWESYGTLNAERSNAILICLHFSGTSHAAGQYTENDALPGYWDAVVGPGKAIDTDKYFVFSSDTLVNVNAVVSKARAPSAKFQEPAWHSWS